MSYKITYNGIDANEIDWEVEFKIKPNNRIVIPQGQKDVIKQALQFYILCAKNIGCGEDNSIHFSVYDMNQLLGMMDYPISIDISKEEQILFTSKYGIDFPEY